MDEPRERADRRIGQLRRIYADHGRLFRVTWVAVGVIVALTGVAMIVIPGPSTIVIPAGLVMLAAVFGWARRVLMASIDSGVKVKHRLDDAPRAVRVLGIVASVCLAAAAVALPLLL